jgi:hypothetical protein
LRLKLGPIDERLRRARRQRERATGAHLSSRIWGVLGGETRRSFFPDDLSRTRVGATTGMLTPTASPITVPTPQFVGIIALPL